MKNVFKAWTIRRKGLENWMQSRSHNTRESNVCGGAITGQRVTMYNAAIITMIKSLHWFYKNYMSKLSEHFGAFWHFRAGQGFDEHFTMWCSRFQCYYYLLLWVHLNRYQGRGGQNDTWEISQQMSQLQNQNCCYPNCMRGVPFFVWGVVIEMFV